MAWAVCFNRTPELMQSVVDSAPHARNYYSDAFNTYRELCWWGTHQAMYDKSQTYSVEGTNADLRHYLARLGRRSRPRLLRGPLLRERSGPVYLGRPAAGERQRPGPAELESLLLCAEQPRAARRPARTGQSPLKSGRP